MLVGVNTCKGCAVVTPLPQIAKLHKKNPQNSGVKICELI